jgi:ElaB/YqjD/DUF883 family membrane-anchored ribosome-binding protein
MMISFIHKSTIMLTSNLKNVGQDMKSLVKDAQDLFREATNATGEKAEILRNKGLSLLDTALTKAHDIQVIAIEKGKEAAETADDFVQENPWKAVTISVGVGLLVGLLIARK